MKEKTVARLKPRTFKARSVLTNLEEQAANANRISYKYKGEPASFFRAKLISGDGQEGCFPHGTGLYKQVYETGFMTVAQ